MFQAKEEIIGDLEFTLGGGGVLSAGGQSGCLGKMRLGQFGPHQFLEFLGEVGICCRCHTREECRARLQN